MAMKSSFFSHSRSLGESKMASGLATVDVFIGNHVVV